jgi:hypothetical protein
MIEMKKNDIYSSVFWRGVVMSYATLMVYVEPDRMPVERVRLAAHLANKFNAAERPKN